MFSWFHWFRKPFYLWGVRQALKGKPKQRLRVRCLKLAQALEGEMLTLYLLTHSQAVVSVYCSNIGQYTKLLKEINHYLTTHKVLPSDLVNAPQNMRPLDLFFTDDEVCYVDVATAFNSFQMECLRLLVALEPSDTAETGYYEYSLRLLTRFLESIDSILTQLAESHTQ